MELLPQLGNLKLAKNNLKYLLRTRLVAGQDYLSCLAPPFQGTRIFLISSSPAYHFGTSLET